MTDTAANNKRIAKNTLMLYVRMIFTMFVGLYTSRVVLNTLGATDFGLYNVVGGFVYMFTFINSAMAGATQRYLTFELGRGDFNRLQKVFSTSINVHLIISLIILIAAETLGLWFVYNYLTIPEDRFNAALWVYQASILSTIIMMLSVPYNAAIIAHERMSAFAYISVLEVVLKLVIVYALTVSEADKLILYAVLMLLVQILIRLIYGWYCGKHFPETKYSIIFDKKLIREMTGFAGWSLFGNLAAVTFTQGVNVVLNMFFGPAVNAARGIAVQVQTAIKGFCQNFQTALNPQITKTYATGEYQYMHRLIFMSTKFSYFLLLMISLPVMLEADTILTWWLKTVPEHTVSFVRLVLVASMIDATANSLMQGASATGKIKIYQSVIGSILLMILPVSYVTLKLGGQPESVFVVQIIIFAVAQIIRIVIIRPMIHLSLREYFTKAVIPILTVTLVSVVIPVIIYVFLDSGICRFFVICIVSLLSVGFAILFLGLNHSERKFLYGKIHAIANKNR